MSEPLQVLLVEDSEADAALLKIELERAGYVPNCVRVETAAMLNTALDQQKWDLVIADYRLPLFSGLAALALVKEKGLDLPFIIVSGHITEDAAVAAMRAGAHDYVMKDKLARLRPAVQRELREALIRREQVRSRERLEAEQVFRAAIENSVPAGIAAVDLEGVQTYVNPAFCAMVGWREADLVGAKPPFRYWPPEAADMISELMKPVAGSGPSAVANEVRFCRSDGNRFDALLQVTPLRNAANQVTGWVSSALDITERKRAEARLAAEHTVTRILAYAGSIEEAAPAILRALLESLEVNVVRLWLTDSKSEILYPAITEVRELSSPLERNSRSIPALPLSGGSGLMSRVWQERQPVWVEDTSSGEPETWRTAAFKAGMLGTAAFPVQSAGAFFGVLELLAGRRLACDERLTDMLNAISSETGQFMRRRRAEDDLHRTYEELEVRVQQRTSDLKAANARLQTAMIERKRLENELLEITERERRRIGLDLHDDLGQRLTGLALMTKGLERKLKKREAVEASEAARIHGLVQEAISHTRDLAHDLAAVSFQGEDLPAALQALTRHVDELFGISCHYQGGGTCPNLEANVVNQLCKIAQEAVTNAIKHAKAKRVRIRLLSEAERIVLRVQNDGLPFPDLKGHKTGLGLRIMNYRASLIGASLEVQGSGARARASSAPCLERSGI